VLSGAHLPLAQKLMTLVKERDLSDLLVLVGGNVPGRDVVKLEDLGVARVFRTGSRFEDIIGFIEERAGR